MANFQRLILALVFALITAQTVNAGPSTIQFRTTSGGDSCFALQQTPYTDIQKAHTNFNGLWPLINNCFNPPRSHPLVSSTGRSTGIDYSYGYDNDPAISTASYTYETRAWCPATDTAPDTAGQCSNVPAPPACPSGQTLVNGQCQKNEGCQKGLPQRGSVAYPGSVSTVCFGGCEATPISVSNQYYCSGGTSVPTQCSVGIWEQTGQACPSGSPSAGAAPPDTQRCAAGTCPGTVNGVTTCLACTQNNSTTDTSTSTSTNSDGTKSETTTSTTCQGEACTTTTSTKTTPVTGTPTVDTKTEPSKEKKSFCQENPTFSACTQGTFSGSCGSPPACTGDAVQCATARATFETNCTLNPAPSSLSNLGNSLASGTENLTGAGLSSQANREVVNLQTSLDTSKFLATGCPPDRIISLPKGQSITLPFSRLCGVFQFMGSIVIAFSLLAASRIVGVV